MYLSDCPDPCSFGDFVKRSQPYFPVTEWDEACGKNTTVHQTQLFAAIGKGRKKWRNYFNRHYNDKRSPNRSPIGYTRIFRCRFVCFKLAILHRNIITINDDPASHFVIQSSQQVWSTAKLPNVSESSLGVGVWGRAQRARSVEGWALTKPETAAHRATGFRPIWLGYQMEAWLNHELLEVKFPIT